VPAVLAFTADGRKGERARSKRKRGGEMFTHGSDDAVSLQCQVFRGENIVAYVEMHVGLDEIQRNGFSEYQGNHSFRCGLCR
jgi:hypothetical protein